MKHKRSLVVSAALLCLVVVLCGGCASTQMKGTPFYTGEYSVRRGPAEDRVNLWPLLYYRDPALSMLWPLMELTDDHFAMRPLMSIYGLNEDAPVYNVLWPLGRFDTRAQRQRIFPFFWGDEYFVGFPFYWHSDDPWGDGGYNGLLPLWSYRSGGKNRYSTHLLWPFLHVKHWSDENTGWRIWPLAGSYNRCGGRYRFAAWPLGHQWCKQDGKTGGSCFVPLYYHRYDNDDSLFLSLPYSRGNQADRAWETVLPLYHRRKSPTERSFYSLIYSYGEDEAREERWSLAVPLWYSRSGPDRRLVATFAGGYRRQGATRQWMAAPLLAGGRVSEDSGDVWVGGPLAHVGWDGDYGSHHLLPFYYRSRSGQGKRFYSLLWSSGADTDGNNWQALFPLMYRHRDADSRTLVTPLYAQGTADGGDTRWRSVIPLVFNRKTRDEHLVATLLGGYRRRTDALSWLAYPLLSGGKVTDAGGSFWAAAPLVHARWDGEHAAHHVLPFYYRNGWNDMFMSLPYARWKHDDATTTLIPPTTSWLTQRPERSDLWMLGPLAHLSWGEDAGSSHIVPLYYRNPNTDAFASLLATHWRSGTTENWLVPPLLSLYSEQGQARNLYAVLGLFHQRWGEHTTAAGHLVPFYMYRKDDYFFALLFGRKQGRDGFVYPLTPLVGIRGGDYAGGWFFPFWSRRRHRDSDRVTGTYLWGHYWHDGERGGSGILPFYGYENFGPAPELASTNSPTHGRYGKRFWSLPACWYRNVTTVNRTSSPPVLKRAGRGGTRHVKKHGFFPLWHYAKTDWLGRDHHSIDGSILLLLYDYQRRVTPACAADEATNDYTRARVLWRIWHYERSNGNVSVDMFPAITYDSKPNGFRKVSFLWRLFRYEKGPEGKKLDVCFLPIIRKDTE